MTYQQITIVGNVGKDAELKYTPSGVSVCDFSVAVNKVTGKGDNKKEFVTWFRVTVWRERAEIAAQYIRKGMKVLVIGEIQASAYTAQSGKPAASLELTASDFKFLSSVKSTDPDEPNNRTEPHDFGNQIPPNPDSVDETDSGGADIPF